MKRAKAAGLALALILLCAACAQPQAGATPPPSGTPGISAGAQGNSKQEADAQPPEDQDAGGKNNRLYDPSIYVIEATGAWRHEVADGYWADYECELYLDKVDANDNRSSNGTYSGFFWMGVELDAAEYIKDMLGDVPVAMGFSAGGEGICDNIAFHLRTRDIRERDQYAIPLKAGGEQAPAQDVLVDKGSFIVVGKQAYLDAVATGKQGETLEHHGSEVGDVELSYVIHMQPDAYEQGVERAVTIYVTDGQGMSATIFGTMRRLPGYPDDVSRYVQDAPWQEALNKRLE